VKHRVLAWLAIAMALAACSGNRTADPASRFFAVHNVMRAIGLYQTGPVNQGTLAAGQEVKLPLTLPSTCVAIVAMGGAGVADIALRLLDPDGNLVVQEKTHDVEAVVRACLERPGQYVAVLRMEQGAGEYLVSSWTGGDGFAAEAGAPLASGGTCEAPTVLVAGRSYAGTTEDAPDDQEGSCSGSAGGRERVYRLDLPTRQRVGIEVSADFDSVLYIRKGDCNDEGAEVRCNDDSGPKHSRIDAVLDPGMYFVFVDGYGDETGSYRIQATTHDAPSLADICKDARPLAAASRVVGTATEAFDNANATCGRDAKGNDLPYRFDLPTRARVRFVERSADFRSVVHVRRSCEDATSEVACGDSGFADDEASWAGVLEAGAYWVFADGSDEAAPGSFTLSAETAPESGIGIGAGTQGDGCGDAIALTGLSGKADGDTFAAKDDVGVTCAPNGGADVIYRLDLAHRSRVTARLVADESSHALALERACADKSTEVSCGSIVDRLVEPGTYFIVVDGAKPESLGRFSFSYKIRDMAELEAACTRVPVLSWKRKESGTTVGASDKFSSSCGGRGASRGSSDRVYRFAVPRRATVRLTLETEGFRGVLSVRRACADDATEVKCAEASDDGSRTVLQTALEPGTYYAVVDGTGSGSEGSYSLRLEGTPGEAGNASPAPRPTRPARPSP
jgi:hypothetical protein